MLLALRINVLAKGYSGVSLETLQQLLDAFNGRALFFYSNRCSITVHCDLTPGVQKNNTLIDENRELLGISVYSKLPVVGA